MNTRSRRTEQNNNQVQHLSVTELEQVHGGGPATKAALLLPLGVFAVDTASRHSEELSLTYGKIRWTY